MLRTVGIVTLFFTLQSALSCAPCFAADRNEPTKGDSGTSAKIAPGKGAAIGRCLTRTSSDEVSVGNNYLTLLIRKGAPGAECHYRLGVETIKGPVLLPAIGESDKARAITAFRMVEDTPARALVEVDSISMSGKNMTTRYLLRENQPLVEVQPGEGMERLRLEATSRYAVVPDIFAGDMVINPATVAQSRLRLPSENLLLHLTTGGNAIVACVWRSAEQAVRLTLGDGGDGRAITETEVACPKNYSVSVAVLAATGIWHQKKVAELNPVKDVMLDWKVPFRALWRADYPRTDSLIDSWKCLLREGKDRYESFGIEANKARTVWTSARGSFAYPTYMEGGSCFLRKTQFEGSLGCKYDDSQFVVIYPSQAVRGTPPGTFGALDILREALKETPEASLLGNLEIKKVARDRWPATCAVTADYEKVFDAGEEKANKAFLLGRLEEMNQFVINIRSRMKEYQDWQRKTREFLAKAQAEQPQVAPLAEEFDGILATFDKIYERRKLDERTPAAARVLIDKVAALIDSPEGNKDEKTKQLGRDTRTIGGNQDSCLGEFRMFTKRLRQRAGYRMAEAQDDAAFHFAREVRRRTMEMLQFAFVHESAQTD